MVLRILKIVLGTLLVVVLAATVYFAVSGKRVLRVATGSVSRSWCSATFVSGIDPDQLYVEEQLQGGMRWLDWALRYDVDRVRREVRTSVAGGFGARAVYRPGLGCLVVQGDGTVPEAAGLGPPTYPDAFPQPDVVEPSNPALREALDAAFAEPDATRLRQTKAIVVLQDGKLIAERYAAGYATNTPIWGHSLSKSVTNALIGILVRDGKLRVDQPAPMAAWRASTDPRNAITIDQLLRMTSGLPFDDTDAVVNPLTRMLFLERDMAGYAAQLPLDQSPGTAWGYSNAGYMILSRLLRNAAGNSAVETQRFVRRELFAPLGMRTATLDIDATGTPIGASNMYASARDWARFGQLYLDDGVAGGRRLLPQGWVAYSASQTLQTGYGAGFWTNLVTEGSVPIWDAPWGMPELPRDAFYARGALGQYIVIVPSKRLVVARLGLTQNGGSTGIGGVVARIIAALQAPGNIGPPSAPSRKSR